MNHTRSALTAVALMAILALASPPAMAAPDSGDLYLQQASGGKLSGSKLVLTGVSGRVTTFTDRPQRRASSLTTNSFVSRFGSTFRGDPPNAALQIDGRSARNDVALLELRRPRYDRRKRTLTYTVKRLKRTSGGLAKLDRRADRGVRGRFGRATLFIDSGGAGDYFSVVLSAPPGQTTSISLSGGASFDLEAQTQIFPLGTATPTLNVQGSTMSVNVPSNASGSGAMVVMSWIDVSGQALTGSATIPQGGSAEIGPSGNLTPLTNGAFSVPF